MRKKKSKKLNLSVENLVWGELSKQVTSTEDLKVEEKRKQLRAYLTQKQQQVLDDPARRKAILCGRRAGKTVTDLIELFDTCLANKRARCLFLGRDKQAAKRACWDDLVMLNETYQLGAEVKDYERILRFPNGSTLEVSGVDTAQDAERIRGTKYHKIAVDECASFPVWYELENQKKVPRGLLDDLIEKVLQPALRDHRGTLILSGTPGTLLAGLFYEATRNENRTIRPHPVNPKVKYCTARPYEDRLNPIYDQVEFRWSFHRWHVMDNTALPHLWEAAEEEKLSNGWADDHPTYRRETLGEWVSSANQLVFCWTEEKNRILPEQDTPHGLPDGHDWAYLMGIDIGYTDPCAFVISAYSDTYPDLIVIEDYQETKMDVDDIARKIQEYLARYEHFQSIVADAGSGGAKNITESLRNMYGLPVQDAQKGRRRPQIELIRTDLNKGRIKLMPGTFLELEWSTQPWDDTGEEPDPGFPDHSADAMRYLFHNSYHRLSDTGHDQSLLPGTPEWYQVQRRLELERAIQAKKAKRNPDAFDVIPILDDNYDDPFLKN